MQYFIKYFKAREGMINLIIFLFGTVGILLACLFKKQIDDTFYTVMLSISTSIVASTIVSFIMAGYLFDQKEKSELMEKWGIKSLNSSRGIINAEVDELFEGKVRTLDIIAYGLKSFREARSDRIKYLLKTGMRVRIITVNPESKLLRYKDIDENKIEGSTAASIRDLIDWSEAIKKETGCNLEIRVINTLPTEVYFKVDDDIFVGPYQIGRESQQTITMRYGGNADGADYYKEYFERIWRSLE